MSVEKEVNISVEEKTQYNVQVDPVAFKHELTQIYLELKNTFTSETVAQQTPPPELDEEILCPKTEWILPEISVKLPEAIDVVSHKLSGYSFDSEVDAVYIQPQEICEPEIYKLDVECSKEYGFTSPSFNVPKLEWCESELPKIDVSDFSLITPSISQINQGIELADNVNEKFDFEFNFAAVTWEQKDVHIDGEKFNIDYEIPDTLSLNIDSVSYEPINFNYKLTEPKISKDSSDFSLQLGECSVDIPSVNNNCLLGGYDVLGFIGVESEKVNLSFFDFSTCSMVGDGSVSETTEILNCESILSEIRESMGQTVEMLKLDLLKR